MSGHGKLTIADEARYLHGHFFEGGPDQVVVDRYVEACNRILGEEPSDCSPMMQTVMENHLDPEALEIALRLKGQRLLTQKVQILFFLVEVRQEYFPYFFNTASHRGRGIWLLLKSLILGSFKIVKGRLAARRHGLV